MKHASPARPRLIAPAPVVALLLAALLPACSMVREPEPEPEPTLADLGPATPPPRDRPLPRENLEQVAARYRQALDQTPDAETRVQVNQRLADITMLGSEQRQLNQTAPTRQFDAAIAAYQTLLRDHPGRDDNDRILYQLAKAFELDGRGDEALPVLDRLVREYPESDYYVEAQFRRGELLFARGRYSAAEGAYAEVARRGAQTPYIDNALYMHGWTLFKQNDYGRALESFSSALDLLWPEGETLDALERSERELVDDTLRVMSIGFSNLDGARGIERLYARIGQRHYHASLYDRLGQLYLQQKRYRDAADTWRAYVEAQPASPLAPAMYVKLIDAYAEGRFPDDVLAQKAAYAQRYGVHSTYWNAADDGLRTELRAQLKIYLAELAQFHHAAAQQAKQALAAAAAAKKAPPAVNGERPTTASMQQSYRRAADYYQQYIDTFPSAPEVGGMVFLLAESRFEAEEYAAAIRAYEAAAYQYRDPARGAEAGYSAILAHDRLIAALPAAQRAAAEQAKIDSELRFAGNYPDDKRAAAVQGHAAETLFKRQDYAAAIAAATPVTQWQPAAATELRRSAWLVIAHSQFELQRYPAAEQGYREALALLPAADAQRGALGERLAAAVYKQGEAKLAAGDGRAAAQEFLRVAAVAPDASIRVNAQYDAATQLMAVNEWQQAIGVLGDLRTRFPDHALSAGVAAKLAAAYQASGQPGPAAAELTRVARQEKDPQARREALLAAAELYRQAGDNRTAIDRYRDYVEQFPQPFAAAMEARQQLVELYGAGNNSAEQRRWQQLIIDADARAGAQRNERSRYLAASAQDQLAEAQLRQFSALRLTLPLKASLAQKRAAMERALQAYSRSAAYDIQEFSTRSTFRIGEIYAGFSRELMASPRPPELDALALEQYELLLEEEAFPFEEKAIAIHEGNVQRSWQGIYDEWVKRSFDALATLLPARYGKRERRLEINEAIY